MDAVGEATEALMLVREALDPTAGRKGAAAGGLCWLVPWPVEFSSQGRRLSLAMDKGQERNSVCSTNDQEQAQTQADCGLDEKGEWKVF